MKQQKVGRFIKSPVEKELANVNQQLKNVGEHVLTQDAILNALCQVVSNLLDDALDQGRFRERGYAARSNVEQLAAALRDSKARRVELRKSFGLE